MEITEILHIFAPVFRFGYDGYFIQTVGDVAPQPLSRVAATVEDGGAAFVAGVLHPLRPPAFRHFEDGGKQVAGAGRLCRGVVGHAGGVGLCASGTVSRVVSGGAVDGGEGNDCHAAAVCADYAG